MDNIVDDGEYSLDIKDIKKFAILEGNFVKDLKIELLYAFGSGPLWKLGFCFHQDLILFCLRLVQAQNANAGKSG